MTEETFKELKDTYIDHLKEMMIEDGELHPMITIFADHIEEDVDAKGAIVHLPIPPEFMKNDDSKDNFIEEMLPKIAKEVRKKFIPYAIAWSAEAWMRTADKKEDGSFEPSMEKEEVVIITVEKENDNETCIYKIIRKGMQIDNEGLKDPIELERTMQDSKSGIGGRFTGLFKIFKNDF
jgi:hypothetical protein